MYRYGLHTVRHIVFKLRRIPPSSSCSSDKASPQRNGRRRSVPATKWQATKCPRDEMVGDKVYPRRNGGDEMTRRNGSDEMPCSAQTGHPTYIKPKYGCGQHTYTTPVRVGHISHIPISPCRPSHHNPTQMGQPTQCLPLSPPVRYIAFGTDNSSLASPAAGDG